jgi:hypothetical protein
LGGSKVVARAVICLAWTLLYGMGQVSCGGDKEAGSGRRRVGGRVGGVGNTVSEGERGDRKDTGRVDDVAGIAGIAGVAVVPVAASVTGDVEGKRRARWERGMSRRQSTGRATRWATGRIGRRAGRGIARRLAKEG